jgi:branched-chain amino acid transport system permease protein
MQLTWNIAITASLLLLAGMSFSLPFRITGTFDFSHGILFVAAPVVVWVTQHLWTFPTGIAIFAGIFVACVVGLVLSTALFWAIARGVEQWQVVVASLGIYITLQNLISCIFGDDLRFLYFDQGSESLHLLGGRVTQLQIATLTTSLCVFAGLAVLLRVTMHGKLIAGVASNRELCVILGISPVASHFIAAAAGALIAAINGVLIAADTGFTPAMGFRILLGAFVVVIVSGKGSTSALLFGAIAASAAQHLAAYFVGSRWAEPAMFLLLIGFLLWKPRGLRGAQLRKVEI